MSENCLDKNMLAISSSPNGPSQLPKAFSANSCKSDSESVANESISNKPAIQIKMVPSSSESHQSASTCKDVIIVNGVDLKTIVVNSEAQKKVGGMVSCELPSDSQVGQTLKETPKEIASKLIKDSLSTCEFSSDDEVMDSSVLQVIDEVGCSSPESPPADVEGVVKQDEIEKVTSLAEPENIGEASQSVADDSLERMPNNSPTKCTKQSEGNTDGDCKLKADDDRKDKSEDQDYYISLLKKRLTSTESEAEGHGRPASKKFRLDDPDDGQHVTVEVDPPFLAHRCDSDESEQGGKPTRRITKGELQKLVEKMVLEQVTASDRSQMEGLKLKCEQLERCSEKWRKKAFTLQKQITEQQIVIQRQNLTKKPPYILKPQMRSVGLQVEQARIQQGNMAASNRPPQVPLLPKTPQAASVTIRPIGPAVSQSPNKYTVSTNPNTNGVSVSILQNRGKSSPPGLRPLNTPLPIPNVTVTPSNVFQITNNKVIESKVVNRNAKGSPGNAEVPASPTGQSGPPLPVPMRLIPNQSVARQTSTVAVTTKSPSMPIVSGATAVKFIDLSNDDEAAAAAATTPANKDKVVLMPSISGPPNMSVVSSSAGSTISINTNCGTDTRALTILAPSVVPSISAPRKMLKVAPMSHSTVAMPMTPLRLSTAQVARPVSSQQILHSTNIPNGARVTYLVPSSVALVRPPLNGTIVTQPIQRFGQPTTIIRTPITAQTVLFERRVTGTNVTGIMSSPIVSTAPTTIVKTIVAGAPTPSIVTPLATCNAPLIRRLQNECEKAMMQHPAPLPSPHYTSDATKPIPPSPSLKVSKETNGIVLSWDMPKGVQFTDVNCYQLYAYQESSLPASTSLWKKVGDVKALPLPMACTLTQFLEGHKYHFSVRAVDNNGRIGRFSVPGSIMLASKQPQQPSTVVKSEATSTTKCDTNKTAKMVRTSTDQHHHFLLNNTGTNNGCGK